MGEVYLTAEDIAGRVQELGAEIAADYVDREPLLVAALKASLFFVTDLSRGKGLQEVIDFIVEHGGLRAGTAASTAA